MSFSEQSGDTHTRLERLGLRLIIDILGLLPYRHRNILVVWFPSLESSTDGLPIQLNISSMHCMNGRMYSGTLGSYVTFYYHNNTSSLNLSPRHKALIGQCLDHSPDARPVVSGWLARSRPELI